MASYAPDNIPSIDHVIILAQGYMPGEDLSLLSGANEYAAEIYKGRTHLSGAPLIAHALDVVHTLASMHLDKNTLAAGLLHGVLKDAPPEREAELRERFGEEVATLVRSTTRITSVQYSNHLAWQAESVRNLLFAMAADIRVLLVRLADRLNDMQTIPVSHRAAREKAQETLDLFAPLASRLGIDWMKRELEDLSFKFLHPKEFYDLSRRVESSTADRAEFVENVKQVLYQKMKESGLGNCRVLGRPKHLFSIYKKLVAQKIPLEKVYDKVAFRLILQTVPECYEALGVVHSLWTPIPHRFKDFISKPKSNGYRSLHTSVVGPHNDFMEIQIRTEEMDEVAQEGIAAHWAYKEGKSISKKDAKHFQWLKQLVQGIQEVKDPREFLETVKGELATQEEIYVLTPNGDVKGLSYGSTPLDFAYSIHTEVGHHCAGAKVNNRIVSLRHELQNGDVVEILTSPGQWPNQGWLSLVKTSRAKNRIRQWLRHEEQERSLHIGQEICERELRKRNLSLKKVIKTGHLKELLKAVHANSLEDLLRSVGRGKITIQDLIDQMMPPELRPEEEKAAGILEAVQAGEVPIAKPAGGKRGKRDVIQIDGIDGVLVHIGQCCLPVPGDAIEGFITAGRGVSVHKANCRNLLATDPTRRVGVSWTDDSAGSHRAQVQVLAQDQRGLLATISNAINNDDANIISLEAHTTPNNLANLKIVVEITGREHLQRVVQHLRQIEGVIEAHRM